MDAPYLEAHVRRNRLGKRVWSVDDADEQTSKAMWGEPSGAVKAPLAYLRAPPKGVVVNLVA